MTTETFGEHPINHYIPVSPKDDDGILAHANDIRQMVINAYMVSGVDIADHKKMANLEKFLRGYDGQALTKKRIEAQNKTGDGLASIAHVMEEYLQRRGDGAPRFTRHDGDENSVSAGPANLAALTVEPRDFIEGQLEASGTSVNIDKIMEEGLLRARGGASESE